LELEYTFSSDRILTTKTRLRLAESDETFPVIRWEKEFWKTKKKQENRNILKGNFFQK